MIENEILQLVIYTIAGFIVGFAAYRWLTPHVKKLAQKTNIQSDDLIIDTISSWVISWCTALGLFVGLRRIDMADKYHVWLEKGLLIFFILSITIILSKVIAGMLKIKSTDTDAVIPSSSIISNIVKVIVYIIGLLIILHSLGISITPMLTALGVGGLAVALALQTTLSNLFAGVQLISSGKINTGDFIKLSSGEDGFIEDITWRSTTIRAASDHMIIVPNNKLADMIVSNYYLPLRDITVNVLVGVGYESDLEFVEKVVIEEIKSTLIAADGGVNDFEPFVRFVEFGDSSIIVKCFLRVKSYTDQFVIKHTFLKNIHKRFKQEGINIPFPIRTVLMPQNKRDIKDTE